MLINTSGSIITLSWGGMQTTLLPGQSCTYLDPLVEQRMKRKYPEALSYEPDPPKPVGVDQTVIVNPPPQAAPSESQEAQPASEEAASQAESTELDPPRKRGRPKGS